MGFFYMKSFTSITGAHLGNPQEPLCKGIIRAWKAKQDFIVWHLSPRPLGVGDKGAGHP